MESMEKVHPLKIGTTIYTFSDGFLVDPSEWSMRKINLSRFFGRVTIFKGHDWDCQKMAMFSELGGIPSNTPR